MCKPCASLRIDNKPCKLWTPIKIEKKEKCENKATEMRFISVIEQNEGTSETETKRQRTRYSLNKDTRNVIGMAGLQN